MARLPSDSKRFPHSRSEIEGLNRYIAPLEGRRNLLRLDFNENTVGPSPKVLEALHNIPAEHIAIYPEYDGLREAFIGNLTSCGLSSPLKISQVGLFNGVDAAINAVFHAYGDKSDLLLTTSPTFGYYKPCAHMQGMLISAVPYEGEAFRFPFETITSELVNKKPRLCLICNPNNPTGTRLPPELILQLATLSPETLFVIDELYEAFTGDSVLQLIDFQTHPNILVLRSLSKTAGLAGLRIGFAIGDCDVVDRVMRVTGPYDINSFAVAAAFASLADQDYINSYVSQVLNAKDWISSKLKKSALRYHLDGGNYFLIWPRKDPSLVENLLRDHGILVRSMSNKPLLKGALRVSIGTINQMQLFWSTFASINML